MKGLVEHDGVRMQFKMKVKNIGNKHDDYFIL